MKPVTFIVTMDFEIAYDHDEAQQASILEAFSADMRRLNLKNTIFCTSDAVEKFEPWVRRWKEDGHEVACHGKTHALWENFETMNREQTRDVLKDSLAVLTRVTGGPITGFRGPRMETSATTQDVLEELGFQYDFSISSRRIYLPFSWRKFVAPQVAYRPHPSSPYKRGTRPLVCVPLTSFLVPFLSGMLYLFGLSLTKIAARFFLWICRITGRPLVYLYHSYEFTDMLESRDLSESAQKNPYFVVQPLRQRLYRFTPRQKYEKTLALFRYILSQKGVVNRTGKEFHDGFVKSEAGGAHVI